MNKMSIINKVKYSKTIYSLYKNLGGFALSILKLFVKPSNNLILFVSFGGRKYDDSPRCIYEAVINDKRFDNYQLVWAFIDPSKHILKGRGDKIKIDTLKYFVIALKARVWITNSSIDRGLSFKGKHTFYFNTWHGSAIKRIGVDMATQSFANASGLKQNDQSLLLFDAFCAQSQYDVDVFSHAFHIPQDTFRVIGLPRNDELVLNNKEPIIEAIKKKYDLPNDKKVILYAPTFREYDRDEGDNCVLTLPMNLTKWQNALENQYVLLFRAHYEIVKHLEIKDNQFVRNVSDYSNLNELMLVSDICISDYSSIFFDFSILGRPMLCWAYDYEEYCEKRGLYFNIKKALCNESIRTEDELIDYIKQLDMNERMVVTEEFRKKYVSEYGRATFNSLKIIANELNI